MSPVSKSDNAVSHVNYDGRRPVCQFQTPKITNICTRERCALVYCLTCVFALFLPSTGALVVFTTAVATTLLVFPRRGATLAALCGVLVGCAHFYRYEDTQIPSGCFDTPIQVEGVIVSFPQRREGVGDSYYLSFDFEIRESIPHECASRIKVRAYAHYKDVAPALKIGDSIAGEVRLRPHGVFVESRPFTLKCTCPRE